MTDLASTLANSTIESAAPELREGTVLDDLTERGQPVRCIAPSLDANLATDPMPWEPHMTAEGEFWPKKGDRVVLGYQPDGPPVIQWWEPAGEREPDAAIARNVPSLILDGETFTVSVNKQALWAIPIEIEGEGILRVDGTLVEVN